MVFYLNRFGYIAILIGTICEGGTLLSMGGFAAHQGYLKLVPWVILAGMVGSFIDAQIWYTLGRSGGAAFVKKRPKWQPRLAKIDTWLKRYDSGFIVFARFIPGFRTASSLAVGMSGVSPLRFILLNVIGALLWAGSVGLSGFIFGRLLKIYMGEIKHLELPILVGIAVAGAAILVFVHHRRRQQERAAGSGYKTK